MINKEVTYTTILDRTYIENQENGISLFLDENGTQIWNLIIENLSESEIVRQLCNKYSGFENEIKKM